MANREVKDRSGRRIGFVYEHNGWYIPAPYAPLEHVGDSLAAQRTAEAASGSLVRLVEDRKGRGEIPPPWPDKD